MTKRRRKKKRSLVDDAHTPSEVLLAALLQTGGGSHTESRATQNKRKGRLKGAEKRKFRDGNYDD
jgi:hypothetical protein